MDNDIVVGLDIGYSNLCMVFDSVLRPGETETIAAPAGAGPASLFPSRIHEVPAHANGNLLRDGWRVNMGGEQWVAGVEPGMIQNHPRALHEDYTTTNEYQALLLGALSATGATRVGMLVTGLPVSLYNSRRADLMRRLRGEHQINRFGGVVVDNVKVLPQPLGSFFSSLLIGHNLDAAETGVALVVDIGFFSVDWVLVSEGRLLAESCGTSLLAMSQVLAEADKILRERHRRSVGIEHIEAAVREQRDHIHTGLEKVPLPELLADAAAVIAPKAVTEARRALRAQRAPTLVLIAGGGASLFDPYIRDAFKDCAVVLADHPVTSNAHGFWLFGKHR